MSTETAAPEAAPSKTVATTETTTDLNAPPNSLCATCVLWDGGRCPRFRNVREATGEDLPIITGCPDHLTESASVN